MDDPAALLPYSFYRSLPPSWGHQSLAPSIAISIISAALFAGLGFASIVAAIYGFTLSAGVGVFVTACAAYIAPITIPSGVGGILIAVRFARLPRWFRYPTKDD